MEQEEEVRGRASAAEAPRHMSARPFAQEPEQAPRQAEHASRAGAALEQPPRQELRPSPALNKAAQVLCARNRRCSRRKVCKVSSEAHARGERRSSCRGRGLVGEACKRRQEVRCIPNI